MPQRFNYFIAFALSAFFPLSSFANGNVHVSRFWHNHQPLYWPEWNTNGSETNRGEYAWDSIVQKSNRSYSGSTAQHPENNLTDIFGRTTASPHTKVAQVAHWATSTTVAALL
jgi:hypothetical protein